MKRRVAPCVCLPTVYLVTIRVGTPRMSSFLQSSAFVTQFRRRSLQSSDVDQGHEFSIIELRMCVRGKRQLTRQKEEGMGVQRRLTRS